MTKIIVIPDSFKGTMSSEEVCQIIRQVLVENISELKVVTIPVADGGEGSVDAFLKALGGEKIALSVQGPYGEQIQSFWGILKDGTAVIEMAAAAGLTLAEKNLNPLKTTTYGLGQLISHALDKKCKKIIVGMGGSATNDGGAGAAAALGVRFLDRQGRAFVPVGGTLCEIDKIDISGLDPRIKKTEMVAMSDIDNPLTGEQGAAYVFGPQKGGNLHQIAQLDAGLAHLAQIIRRDIKMEVEHLPGAGAAGGLGAGMVAFLGATMQMGINAVLDAVAFESLIEGANLIITGEGKLDQQSLRGKVVIGVAKRAQKKAVPVLAVVGAAEIPLRALRQYGIISVFTINRLALPFEQTKHQSKENLRETMENIVQLMVHLKNGLS